MRGDGRPALRVYEPDARRGIGARRRRVRRAPRLLCGILPRGKLLDHLRELGVLDGSLRLGDLEALQGVVRFPVRIKCATLPWNTLTNALDEVEAKAS